MARKPRKPRKRTGAAKSNVRGIEQMRVKLDRIASDATIRKLGAALYAAGDIIAAEAHVSVTQGSVSGKKHVASKPGEPPKNDTGTLVRNIETVKTGPLTVQVTSNAPYAAALEYGTSKMEARPYMRPARDKTLGQVRALLTKAVNSALKGN